MGTEPVEFSCSHKTNKNKCDSRIKCSPNSTPQLTISLITLTSSVCLRVINFSVAASEQEVLWESLQNMVIITVSVCGWCVRSVCVPPSGGITGLLIKMMCEKNIQYSRVLNTHQPLLQCSSSALYTTGMPCIMSNIFLNMEFRISTPKTNTVPSLFGLLSGHTHTHTSAILLKTNKTSLYVCSDLTLDEYIKILLSKEKKGLNIQIKQMMYTKRHHGSFEICSMFGSTCTVQENLFHFPVIICFIVFRNADC